MSTKSIRFRLTVWYTLAFSIAAIVIFSTFYFITRQSFFSQTDSTLATHTKNIVEILRRQEIPMHQMMIREVFLSEYSDSPGMLVVIMDDTGNIIGSSLAVNQTDQAFSRLFEIARTSKTPFYKDQYLAKIPMRFYVYPLYDADTLHAVVLMAHPMDIIQKSLNHLLITLISVFFLFLIPTILGGFLLAKGGMQPIVETSRKLKEITSENLDERLQNPKTHDEIEELTNTFNDLLDRLHEAFKRERQFIGDVAHELKTPLATQRSGLEVTLSKSRTYEEYKKALSEAIIDNNQISTTLKNILDLAWSEAESTKTNGEIFNLSSLIEELKDIVSKMAVQKQIVIEGHIESNIYSIGKQDKLGRAILNILDNAIKYTQEKGAVSISLTKRRGHALVKIKDTGVGISPEDLPHIFERFYRGAKTDKTFGSGLGLAIAQSIINVHKGDLNVASTLSKGTTVTITLPRVKNSS